MVVSVSLPEEDSLTVLNLVISERRTYMPYQKFYDRISNAMKLQFISYALSAADPEGVEPLNLMDYTRSEESVSNPKNTLSNLYSPKDNQAPYYILQKMRGDNGLLFCPSCGEDGDPGTLDHYFPKSVFPELAICLINLTPMCDKCQRTKSTEYKTVENKRAFIHPYFDDINSCLFKVEISPPYNSPSNFDIKVNDELSTDFRNVVASHITGLGWIDRFKSYCEIKHMHLLRLRSEEREDEDPMSARKMVRTYLRQEVLKAHNAWGAIYYKSVLESPDFLEHLNNGDLPEYP